MIWHLQEVEKIKGRGNIGKGPMQSYADKLCKARVLGFEVGMRRDKAKYKRNLQIFELSRQGLVLIRGLLFFW